MHGGGAVPTLSAVRRWDTTHLIDAATDWTKTATVWEDTFSGLSQSVSNPGGTPWLGEAADAAQQRAYTDRLTVIGAADQLHMASMVASTGADEIRSAKQVALAAVQRAEEAGFTVGEDFSLTDRETGSPASIAARQAQAQSLATDIRLRVGELIAADQRVAGNIVAAADGLGGTRFTETDTAAPDSPEPTIQMVDDHTVNGDGREPPPKPPSRGLPPEDVQPPVDGPLTPGPASRPSEAGKGGQSLWDEQGGELRDSGAEAIQSHRIQIPLQYNVIAAQASGVLSVRDRALRSQYTGYAVNTAVGGALIEQIIVVAGEAHIPLTGEVTALSTNLKGALLTSLDRAPRPQHIGRRATEIVDTAHDSESVALSPARTNHHRPGEP
ncbi:hypothetical protein BH09ACT7_BH09ACT7_55270 [soil metagenome]